MTDCEHTDMTLHEDVRFTAHTGDNGLPRQITLRARCHDCGNLVDVDYNIAFVDGDSA